MQQYQNYYPMYQNNYGQMQNPYMQRMENLQQFQQAINQPQAPVQMPLQNQQFAPLGKIVESVDMVKTTDIPMDGNMYYFPKADGSMVFSKKWLPNGSTQILAFKPILEDKTNISTTEEEKLNLNTFSELLEGIQNDIRTLNDKVDKISKPSRTKKEVAEDE